MAWIFDEQQVGTVALSELPEASIQSNSLPASAYYNDVVRWQVMVRNNGGNGWIACKATVVRASDSNYYDEESLYALVSGGSTQEFNPEFQMPDYDVEVTVAVFSWDDPTTDPANGP